MIPAPNSEWRARAEQYLQMMLGAGASFRPDQWEAVEAIALRRERLLLVERTGWGKSLVYFLATRLLRDTGAGPTLLVSPLLSLMRNQVEMARRIGVRAATLNSGNAAAWREIEEDLRSGAIDVLLVSPERLANRDFRERTVPLMGSIGLLVVDEAHCISDWGHDFRPDYRRIVRIAGALPVGVPVLATTATANDRVVEDVADQLGPGLQIVRGPLARPSLRLQSVRLTDQSERLAWLLENVPKMIGTGIIYCLTVHDCVRVAQWLQSHRVDAPAYHGQLETAEREALEQRLLDNNVKALVATVALGMGFDKPDLGFVVHFQRPGSPVAYYQQIGRAGRALDDAPVVLLNGREDDDIQEFFIRTALPPVEKTDAVVRALEESDEGLSLSGIEDRVNVSRGTVEKMLKLLEVDEVVSHEGSRYFRTLNSWTPVPAHAARVVAQRQEELARMQQFTGHEGCLLEFLTRELDDPAAAPCGRCANCAGDFMPRTVSPRLVNEAREFLRESPLVIEPRRQWPAGAPAEWKAANRRNGEGRALSVYGDAGWGWMVARGKYVDGRFSDELVDGVLDLILRLWQPDPFPQWITAVPSSRHPELVADFAERLASALGLPFHPVLVKIAETPEQKLMENSAQQMRNVEKAFAVEGACAATPVLLVDDVVDSRWTMTVCGQLLTDAGSGLVFPFALAMAVSAG